MCQIDVQSCPLCAKNYKYTIKLLHLLIKLTEQYKNISIQIYVLNSFKRGQTIQIKQEKNFK